MNAKSMIPLVIGLAIGGYALKLVIDTVKNAKGAEPDTVNVWTAREDIPRGTPIDETMIAEVEFPLKAAPEGTFTVKEDLLGRVPRITAPAGLPILEPMLLAPGSPSGLWVKPGFRAVSIRIDESSGVSNLLQPGSKVDVVGYFRVNKSGRQETISRTLIENVEVAAVGAQISVAVEEEGKKRGVKPARAVTLFVKPASVPVIHLAEQMGKIKLSMRSADDNGVADLSDATRENDVLGFAPDDGAREAANKSLMDKIKGMFSKRDKREREMQDKLRELEQRKVLTIADAGGFEPAVTMTIWNGDKRTDLGWTSAESREPVELNRSHRPERKYGTSSVKESVTAPVNAAEEDGGSNVDRPMTDKDKDEQEHE